MNYKLLLADDSQINQKVVKKTLASEPFEIIDCPHADLLFNAVKEHHPHLLLLDFNLSDSKTGYELAQEIKVISPDTHVIMMYATFDNIDEDALKKSGCAQKVIKPFDSYKFIALMKSFIPEQHVTQVKEIKSSPDLKIQSKPLSFVETSESWDVMVPDVIGGSSTDEITLPPVMEDEMHVAGAEDQDVHFPKEQDLDYPEIETFSSTPVQSNENYKPQSKLIPAETLKPGPQLNEIDFDHEEEEKEKLRILEEQIKDEVSSNLWIADEKVKVTAPQHKTPIDKDIFSDLPFQAGEVFTQREVPIELTDEVKRFISQKIEEEVKKYFDLKINKAIWESIPGVAEKIIGQELSKITKSISDSI